MDIHIFYLFFWNVPRYEIAELCSNSMSNFGEIVGLFSKVTVTFYIPQQNMRVPVASHSCQYILLSLFLITAIPVSMKWYLTVVLICLSLMICDVEHLFMYLSTICISSLQNAYLRRCPFLN